MKLLIGNPTGHEDQHSCTLVVGHTMLRGPLSVRDATALRDVLAKGCKMTGREFTPVSLSAARRKHAPTE